MSTRPASTTIVIPGLVPGTHARRQNLQGCGAWDGRFGQPHGAVFMGPRHKSLPSGGPGRPGPGAGDDGFWVAGGRT